MPQVIVNGRFMRARITGVQRYAQEITQRLGDKIRLVAPDKDARLLRGHLWEQVYLPRLLGQNDLLWSPANTGPLAVDRQVLTIHDMSAIDHPEWFNPVFASWYGWLLPRLAKRVQMIITDSLFSRQRILERLQIPEDRVVAIHLGVARYFQPADKQAIADLRARFDLNRDYLLTLGSLEPRKNLARLFAAWAQVQFHFPQVELIVAGEASGCAFKGTGYSYTPPRTRFLDYIPDEYLPALYTGALALIFPSIYEGFGLPLLEAMACGTAVVTSQEASLPEVVGEAALRFDPFDTEAIAAAMERILQDNSLRERLQKDGLQHAQLFTWDVATQQVWDILRQIEDEREPS
jgi:glycosyltransferase involved in cell wall biosynthesis